MRTLYINVAGLAIEDRRSLQIYLKGPLELKSKEFGEAYQYLIKNLGGEIFVLCIIVSEIHSHTLSDFIFNTDL